MPLHTLHAQVGSGLVDLTPLANMTTLRTLNLSEVFSLSDLTPISTLSDLAELFLARTGVTDLRFVENHVNLDTLDLSATPITDVSPLSVLTQLSTLKLNRTPVASLDPIANLSLWSVELEDLVLTDQSYSFINNSKNLTRFYAPESNINTLVSLADLTGLTDVNIALTNVSDISPLQNSTGLRAIDVSYTQIQDPSVLSVFDALHTVNVSGLQMSNVSIVETFNAGLLEFRANDAGLSSLADLGNFPGLERLALGNVSVPCCNDVRSNSYRSLAPLASLTKLKEIDISFTQLLSIAPLVQMPVLHDVIMDGHDALPCDEVEQLKFNLESRGGTVSHTPNICVPTVSTATESGQ